MFFLKKSYLVVLLIFLITFLSFLYNGYFFGIMDQAMMIPTVDLMNNPTLFQGDLWADHVRGFKLTPIWSVIASISTKIPIQSVLIILFFLSRFLFFLAVYILADELFKNKIVSLLSLILFIVVPPSLAGTFLFSSYVHGDTALALCILAIVFFLKKKYFFSFLLIGITFLIHQLFPLYTLLILFVILIPKIIKGDKKFSLISLLPLVIALPVFLMGGETATKSGFDSQWLMINKIRSSFHLFPLSWDFMTWFTFLVYIWIFLHSLTLIKRKEINDYQFVLLLFLFLMISGTCLPYLFPNPIVMIAMPMRSSILFSIIFTPFIAYLLYYYFLSGQNIIKNKIIRLILFSGLFYSLFFKNYILLFPFMIALEAERIKLSWLRKTMKAFAYPIIIFLLIGPYISVPGILEINIANLSRGSLKALSIPLIYYLSFNIINFKISAKRRLVFHETFLILFTLITSVLTYNLNKAFSPVKNIFIDVQKWSFKNTSKTDVFLTPPYLQGFRIYSKRPIFGEWKDGTSGIVWPDLAKKWWRRMNLVGANDDNFDHQKLNFQKIPEEKLIKIARDYHLSYILVERNQKLGLKKVYENSEFTLYKVKN